MTMQPSNEELAYNSETAPTTQHASGHKEEVSAGAKTIPSGVKRIGEPVDHPRYGLWHKMGSS